MGSLPLVHRPRRGVALVERIRHELREPRTLAQLEAALPDAASVLAASLRRLEEREVVRRVRGRWVW